MNDIRPKRNHFPTTFPVKILRLPITFKTIESDSIKIPLSWIQTWILNTKVKKKKCVHTRNNSITVFEIISYKK